MTEQRKKIICKNCSEEKPHQAFGLCKNCYMKYKYHSKDKFDERYKKSKKKSAKRYYAKTDIKDKRRRYQKNWRVENKDKVRSYKENYTCEDVADYRERNPEKYNAHLIINKLIKTGKLKSPKDTQCYNCKKKAEVYHHPDYTQPYIFIPLCKQCHYDIHFLKGKKYIRTKVIEK